MDGLVSARALKVVAAGLKGKLAAAPRLLMVAKIVKATQPDPATRKLVQVRLVGVNGLGRLFRLSSIACSTALVQTSQPCHLLSCMSACLQCTADGLGSDRVRKLVAAGLRAELATTLRLQMVAIIVSAMQVPSATCEFAPVRELFALVPLRRCKHFLQCKQLTWYSQIDKQSTQVYKHCLRLGYIQNPYLP